MAKRISKKLLAGLGTSLVFSTTAFISSLGVKSIIDTFNNSAQETFQFNRIAEASYSQIPNLSTPTRDMFIDTTRLGNFHAGSVRKGQTLTPWGWLGVYTEDNQADYKKPAQQKLALTGWNGEILWVNNDFGGQFFADNKSDIYDIKYDWNTNLIFLARSGNPNGLFKPVNITAVGENSLIIDVLDAQTGTRLQRIENNSASTNDLHNFAWKSFFAIRDNFFDVTTDLNRIEDLYSFDVTSKTDQQALAFYMPNFMQLYQKSTARNIKKGTLPNFSKVLELFPNLVRGWIFDRTSSGINFKTRSIDPRKSSQITGQNKTDWTGTDAITGASIKLNTDDFYLLTNPFWTATNQPDQFVLHFIVANAAGDVYHKIIGFNLIDPGADRNPVLSNFDKTEKISSSNSANSNLLNIKLKQNEWGDNANNWDNNFIEANLRINKNMFDNNVVTFAFPIAANQNSTTKNNFPIFDVAQIKINNQGLIDTTKHSDKLSSRIFDLGNQILNATNSNINPWPEVNKSSLTHNYNRLISISPFDNTFIYNAMPKLEGLNGVYNASDNQNKFLNFWLVNSLTGEYKPFVISNDANLKGVIPNGILRPAQFLKEGFTFDLKSLGSNKTINLYFNHSGADRNDWYGSPENTGMRSAKIGLFDSIFDGNSGWLNDITSPIPSGQTKLIQVSNDSFATLIHSRADMRKWYARTQFNFDRPGNLWLANQQINSSSSSNNRVRANVFNAAITDSKIRQQDAVDLVSHWQVGQGKYDGNTSNQSNYRRLTVKRPVIKASGISNQQVLNITTSYDMDQTITQKYNDLFSLGNKSKNLTFEFAQRIENASWQVFSSWNQQAKMLTHATSSDNISTFTSSLTQISSSPQWYDARQNSGTPNPNNLFGNVHNAISPNTATNPNDYGLRTMLKIEKPTNAPVWLNRADPSFFQAYPISGSEYGNETRFQDILNRFIVWKSQNIDLAEDQQNKASGLANLTIKAFLQVNPRVIKPGTTSNPKIYKNGSKQILLIDNKNQGIIYEDKYNGERTIYDQSSTNYEQMKNYGYGTSVQSILNQSFKNVPPANSKLLINVNLNNLNSNLLRKNNSQDPVFSIEYQSQQQDKLVIKPLNPADQNWFRNRFISFNKMLNLFVVFEYQNQNDNPNTGTWKDLNNSQLKLWTDAELKKNLDDNNGQLVLPTNKNDIKRIRVRLVTKTNNGNPTDANDFIKWENWNNDSEKLVSRVHILQPQKIIIDKSWFNTLTLTVASASGTLDQLQESDVTKYESLLIEKIKQANNNSDVFANQVELRYTFENQQNLNATSLVNAITTALNDNNRLDKGIFTLWDGSKGLKITVKLQIKNGSDDNYVLADTQGRPITNESERSGDLKANIATKIDLGDYFDQLQSSSLEAIRENNQNGILRTFKMPDANSGKFINQTYEQMTTILSAVGLNFQFKEKTNNWSNWMDKNQITKYDPQDPSLMIGLKINNGSNIKVFVKSTLVDSNYLGIKVRLNLPKLVKFPTDLNSLVTKFNQKNPFGGNTYELNVDATKLREAEKIIVDELKSVSEGNNVSGNYNNLENWLEFKYQLGNSPFLSYEKLKEHLSQQTSDQSFNILKVKISIKQITNKDPEFILDADGNEKELVLQENDNQVIKKWIHGTKYEEALNKANSIIPSGNKNSLTYTFTQALSQFSNSNTFPNGLTLEYKLNDNEPWTKGVLPSEVPANVNNIKVRISKQDNEPLYLYGPEEKGNQNEAIIDLSQIPALINVDKNWFTQNVVTSTVISLENLTSDILDIWENQIWQNANLTPELRNKVTIKYSFLSGPNRTNLNKNNLVTSLLSEQNKYNDPIHHGVFKLHDPTQSGINGIAIKATFAKANSNDPTIQFVDQNGSNIASDDLEKLTGIVNTQNIQTTFDLTSYINHLKNNKTNITPDVGGAGTIATNGLIPPILTADASNVLFANQSFTTIENWLRNAGLEFMWSIDGKGSWNTTANTNKYNAQTGQLFLGLQNNSSNLNVKLDSGLTISPKNNSFNNPITIELNAPKVINVQATDAVIMKDFFTGNTKYLNVDVNKIKEKINELLSRQGNQFNNAPLTLMVQVGSEGFVDYKKVAETLKRNPVDVANNVITVKFAIDQNENNASDFQLIKGGDAELTLINDQRIKMFINDQGIFDSLKNHSNLTGQDNTNFTVAWANGWNVDPNSGILNANNIGRGLRLEFSFADLEQDSNNVGTDPKTQWVKKIPTSYELSQKKLYVRIQTQQNYVYEKIESHQNNSEITPINQEYKFSLDLNLPQLIKLESNWLNQPFANQQIDLETLSSSNFDAYENSVKNAINYNQDIKDKISIRYSFDNYEDLNKEQLINKINEYKTSYNDENKNFGILQLWNNNAGKTISAKFVKTNLNDKNYELQINGNNNHSLDLSKVLTTINLSDVLSWLGTIKLEIKPNGNTPDSIAKLVFKPINSPDDLHFHEKTWEQFKQVLNNFNIKIQFRSLNASNSGQPESDWVDNENLLTSYDPNIGKIQIRLKLDNTKTGNLKLKLSENELILGTSDKPTKAFDIKLAIKLTVQINDQFVQEFVGNQDTVKGNTKILSINEANESKMIQAIKNDNLNNNPEFNKVKLLVEYQMGNNQNQNEWRKRDDFIKYLKDQTTDQTSNKIVFRFVIDSNQDSEFSVSDDAKILHNYEAPNSGIKIPYFINKNEWETKANNVAITGTNKNITWQWRNLVVDQNNLITIPAGLGLKIQFSTKSNVNYNDSESTDLTKGWSDTRPISLPIDTNDLYIRLIPANDGFVYESKLNNSAFAHKVILDNFKFLIPVENQWINQKLIVAAGGFIDQLKISDLENYETIVLNNISPSNFKNYVGLTYKFNGESGLTKEELIKKIQEFLRNFNEPSLGILQLDNGIQGHQIEATFINKQISNTTGRNYEIFEQNGKFTNKINTTEIKTNIDLRSYITYLKNNPVKVDGANSTTGDLNKIIMPDFPAGEFAFGGKSYDTIKQRLGELGIKFEAKALGNGVPTNWVAIEDLKKYDPNNGKIQLRLVFQQPQNAQNIVLSILNDKDQNNTTTPFEIESTLKVPLKVQISNQIVNDKFINNNSITGNTRFLNIDIQKEQSLIDAIIGENKKINAEFEKLRGKLKILYQIEGSNEWKEVNQFQDFLRNSQKNWNSNKIKFHFIVNDSSNDFIVDNTEFTLHQEEIGNKSTKVKIYIHDQNYENLSKQIRISGTSSNLNYYWPTGLPINPTTGQINGINGLKIQYTTKKDQDNADYANTNQDPAAGWVDQLVNKIDPVDRYLAIQFVAADGYVYGPQFKKQNPQQNDQTVDWSVHKIDSAAVISEIAIDMNPLEQISFSGEFPNINILEIQKLEEKIKTQVITVAALQEKMKFEYQISLGTKILFNFASLNDLETWMRNYQDPETANLIKFNAAGSSQFATISVRLSAIDSNQYVVLDKDIQGDLAAQKLSAQKGKVVNTESYITVLDLQAYEQILIQNFVQLPENATVNNIAGFNPPGMEKINENVFLAGKTYIEIKKILANLGITIQFSAPKNNALDQWVEQEAIQDLNSKNELFIRFKVSNITGVDLSKFANTFKIKTRNNVDGTLSSNNDFASDKIKLKVDLPILITVRSSDLNDEKIKLRGNTWEIKNVEQVLQAVQTLITNAKNENNTSSTNVNNAPLKIQFQLTGLLDEENNEWFEIEKLSSLLKNSNNNWNTNEIKVRWFIDETIVGSDGFRYQISDKNEIVLQQHDASTNALLKMFIHKKSKYSDSDIIQQKLKPTGTSQSYVINGLDDFNLMLNEETQGLIIQFSKIKQPQNDSDWITYLNNNDLPNPLNSDKDLWFRYEVKDGYEYQGALTNDTKHSDMVKINTSGIKLVLELSTDWLKQIVLTGDLYQLDINEEEAKKLMIASGNLPTGQPNLVFFEYSIDGLNWFTMNQFKQLLLENKGKKDDSNFILKREDIKVRFNLENKINSYLMKIDGQVITDENWSNYNNVQLITEQLNQSVKGHIELKHLNDFNLNNFAIQGTNNKPKLIIKKRQELETLMQIYASDQLFDILISTRKKPDRTWDWSENKSILLPNNHFIDSDQGLVNLGIILDANKQVALKFVSKNSNYDIYSEDKLESNGYVLDISKNVQITVEITNPFTAQGKTLGLWTRENDKAKYYQGQGGFKIVVANKDTLLVEDNGQQSAQEFLKNSSLTDIEKNALELVYHVFDSNAALDNQIEKVKEAINNYDDQETWKSFSEIKESENSDWSTKLNLKVGDYVAVALRVKREYATQDEPFVLKDKDYSMILPVMTDSLGDEKKPGRISGYKINASAIEIKKDSIVIANSASSQLPPLDGWSELQRVDLKPDAQGNYLGVNLKLEVYTEFHEDKANKVLVSGSGLKLVKRQTNNDNPNVTSTGTYKDQDNQEIQDKTGQPVQIWKDKNNRLSAPIKSQTVTKDVLLTPLGGGAFRMPLANDVDEKDRLSLFKNQDIDLKIEANVGEGDAALPDFYLDQDDRKIEIKNEVNQQIKFMVENEQKITYSWNQDEFSADKIKYKAPGNNPDQKPEEGNAQLDTIYKLTKKTPGSDPEVITADTAAAASKALEDQLKKDFNGQLKFETTYVDKKGQQIKEDGNDIYKFKNLSNKDRIVVKIVAVEEDLFYATDQPPLVINVNGLVEASPDQNRLQYLRVKQGGLIDGQGSFKVLVSNPEKDDQDDQSILNGWKFMIRVWDKDLDEKGQHQIKIPWSDDPAQIKGLENGDKVEWKLVSADGNPVKDAYYNTIALNHQQNDGGNIDYQFGQVNYPKGQDSYDLINKGIGAYPADDNQYPNDSGFVISGLRPAIEVFEIDQTSFKSIIQELNLVYVGLDKQGTINIDAKYLEGNYWVNTKGEVYLKEQSKATLNNGVEELNEIPIKEFLDNVTFFTQDPLLFPYQNGFKFSANDANINDHLANGDHLWAQFEMVRFRNEDGSLSEVNSDRSISSIIWQLPDVSGLKNVSDPLSPFWYVLIGFAGIITLGASSLVLFVVSRNKKLKDKK